MSLLTVKYIQMETCAGAEIGACAVEAAKLALEQNAPIRFEHNSRSFFAYPSEIVRSVLREESSLVQTLKDELESVKMWRKGIKNPAIKFHDLEATLSDRETTIENVLRNLI
jgi:hypothetical protein